MPLVVHPFVSPHVSSRLLVDGLEAHFIFWGIYLNMHKNRLWLKLDKTVGHYTWRLTYIWYRQRYIVHEDLRTFDTDSDILYMKTYVHLIPTAIRCGNKETGLLLLLISSHVDDEEEGRALTRGLPSTVTQMFIHAHRLVWPWPLLEADRVSELRRNNAEC